MKPVTFADFYAACVDRLTEPQLRCLNPHAQYFKLDTGYCGLLIDRERTWVSVVVGGIRDVWMLRRVFMKAGVPLVGFKCRLGSPTYRLAAYYGASVEQTDEKYPDGAPVIRCLIHTQQTKRTKLEVSKALTLK